MASDATHFFETYRECARHLRNTYFSTRESKDWDTVEDFDAAVKVLFQRMVLSKLEAPDNAIEENRFFIAPDADRIPLMISREKNGGGYWDHPVKCLSRDDAISMHSSTFDTIAG